MSKTQRRKKPRAYRPTKEEREAQRKAAAPPPAMPLARVGDWDHLVGGELSEEEWRTATLHHVEAAMVARQKAAKAAPPGLPLELSEADVAVDADEEPVSLETPTAEATARPKTLKRARVGAKAV
jgi:hypothetical protein